MAGRDPGRADEHLGGPLGEGFSALLDPDRAELPVAGVEGDGLDAYPTYRDGRTSPHTATATSRCAS